MGTPVLRCAALLGLSVLSVTCRVDKVAGPAPARSLSFTVPPAGATPAGAPFTPAIQVVARDAAGSIATNFTGTVTLAITPGTGTPGATLSGPRTVAAVAGVATFSTLGIEK